MIQRTRLRALAIVGTTLALAATACSSGSGSTGSPSTSNTQTQETVGAVSGGTLNMLGDGDVDYMDPNISYYSIGYLALRMWSRQLFTWPAVPGKTTTAVPDLATEMPTTANGGISADGKTYTISIVKGAMWNTSPPRQVTAADEVRGVKRTCNPTQPFGGIPDFATLIVGYQHFCAGFAKVDPKSTTAIANYINKTPLPGVVAKNQTTVVFKLTQPATYFVDILTLSAFSPAPVEVLKYLPASTSLGEHQISDGPYEISKWDPTKELDFVRNPAWKASTDPVRKAYVDNIDINETIAQDAAQQQLETNTDSADMEFNDFTPAADIPGLLAKKDPGLNLGATASSNPYVIFDFNSPNNGHAMANVKVRQALEYGMNRANMVQVLGGPTISPPLTHVLPPGIVGSKNINLYPYNVAKAKALLAQAGFPNGLTIKMLYNVQSDGATKVFQTVQQDLTKIGVTVKGVPARFPDVYTQFLQVPDKSKDGTWDIAEAGWGADWYGNAALSFFAPLFYGANAYPPSGSNFGFYNSSKTNSLVAAASKAKTEAAAAKLWAEADMQVMKDAAFFPITNPLQPNYHATQVHNAVYVPAIQNYDPTNVWLATGHQGG